MDITGNGAAGEITSTSGAPGSTAVSRDNLMLAVQRDVILNQQRLAARNDGGTELGSNNSVDMPARHPLPFPSHFPSRWWELML